MGAKVYGMGDKKSNADSTVGKLYIYQYFKRRTVVHAKLTVSDGMGAPISPPGQIFFPRVSADARGVASHFWVVSPFHTLRL